MTRYPKKGRGHKWTVRELELVPADWKGDTIADGEGLSGEVRVHDTAVSIVFRYAFKWQGKVAWHYCGAWPSVDMAEVRRRRDEAKAQVASGVDPRARKVADRIEARRAVEATIAEHQEARAAEKTVQDLFDTWIDKGVARKDGNAELRRVMEKDVLPVIGTKLLRDVTDGMLVDLLRGIVARGANRLAAMVLQMIKQMFAWGEKRQPWRRLLIEGNPAELVDLDTILDDDYDPDNVRERVLPPEEIKELARLLRAGQDAYDAADDKRAAPQPVEAATQLAIWICASTICRIGELLCVERPHVNLETNEWLIPRANSKGRKGQKRDFVVFLSPFSANLFRALMDLNPGSRWLFPGPDGEAPVGPSTVTRQVGDRQTMFKKRKKLKGRRNDNTLVLAGGRSGKWTPHDLRRTGATVMQELGVDPNIIDRCQNHVVHQGKNKVRRHYQLYEYAAEKREAWRRLGDYLGKLLGDANGWMPALPVLENASAEVVDIRSSAA